MRRLFKLVFQLLGVVLVFFVLTAVWILFDGLTDLGDKSEIAFVMGTPELPDAVNNQPLLDRVVKLFNDGEFPLIIVSGSKAKGDPEAMVKYLTGKGVPSNVILVDEAATTPEAVRKAAEIMKEQNATSVMIITDYFHVTRTKLAFLHDGVASIQKAHVGVLHKRDAEKIGREVVALYDYIARVYVLPALEKIKQEATVGVDKAKADVEATKKKVDKGFDTMPK